MDRLTEADLDRIRWEYEGSRSDCDECRGHETVKLLLAELDQRNQAVRSWQGRNHQSPVPHLAGVAYGLMGPATSEELPHGA